MLKAWQAFVLPLIVLARGAQGLGPAPAMARDAFGQPICTERGVDRQTPMPAGGHVHDCCAAACQAVATIAPPVDTHAVAVPSASVTAVRFALAPLRGPRGPPD